MAVTHGCEQRSRGTPRYDLDGTPGGPAECSGDESDGRPVGEVEDPADALGGPAVDAPPEVIQFVENFQHERAVVVRLVQGAGQGRQVRAALRRHLLPR